MLRFIQDLFAAEPKPTTRQNNGKRRPAKHSQCRILGMEGLDSRNLMAGLVATVSIDPAALSTIEVVAPKTATVQLKNGDIYIQGTDRADKFTVSYANGKYSVKEFDITTAKVKKVTSIAGSKVNGGDVYFYGYKGDDKFSANNTSLRVTAYGGEGNDELLGSYAADILSGGEGNDTLRSGPGNDKLYGNGGDDYLNGGIGDDVIDGGAGADQIFGELGDDVIWAGDDLAPNYVEGGYGNDNITGGYGKDELHGNDGNDTIDGSLGIDMIFGEADNDTLLAGNDFSYNFVDGGAGNDILHGSFGGDYLAGRSGNDTLYGYGGDDRLNGGRDGYDIMYGGDGDDELSGDDYDDYHGEAGKDTFYVDHDNGWGFEYYPPYSMDREPGEVVFEGSY